MSYENSSPWSHRLKRWLSTAPETRNELIKLVQDCRNFLEPDTVDMLEGVLDLPATLVKEIMTPRTQITAIASDDDLDAVLQTVLQTAHSRYPIFDHQDTDAIIGILLTKDLIPLLVDRIQDKPVCLNLSEFARKPVYISEAARADTLLRLLQKAQVHMAVVLDEFGGVSGVVTMEDLIEEIVGDIVDEHDNFDEDSDINNIVPHSQKNGAWIVQAATPISDCNEVLGSYFDDTDVDTMGGLVMQVLGQVGNLQDMVVQVDDWQISILSAEGRHIQTLELLLNPQNSDDA